MSLKVIIKRTWVELITSVGLLVFCSAIMAWG